MTPLCELSRQHGCDKGGEYHPYGDLNRWSHCYTPVYNALLQPLRNKPIHLLEIGVSEGRSLNMWHEFFPLGHIVGWDIRDDRWTEVVKHPLVCVQKVDQGNFLQMYNAWVELGRPEFDVIIDDGSHQIEDQRASLSRLLPKLNGTGIYVIEDLSESIEPSLPDGYSYENLQWPLDKRQKDPAMADMLQVIRRA